MQRTSDFPNQFKIAQAIQFENSLKRVSQELEKITNVLSQHGIKIKELSTVAANSVSQVEFMAAITTTRFQALNVVKSMKNTEYAKSTENNNNAQNNAHALFENDDKETSHEIKLLKNSLQQLEKEQFAASFKNNMENKKVENELKSNKKEFLEMKNYIYLLEKKLEKFVDAVEDAGISTNVTFAAKNPPPSLQVVHEGEGDISMIEASEEQINEANPPFVIGEQFIASTGITEGQSAQVGEDGAKISELMDDSTSMTESPVASPSLKSVQPQWQQNNEMKNRKMSSQVNDQNQKAKYTSSSSKAPSIQPPPHDTNNSTDDLSPQSKNFFQINSKFAAAKLACSAGELKQLETDMKHYVDQSVEKQREEMLLLYRSVNRTDLIRDLAKRQDNIQHTRTLATSVVDDAVSSLISEFAKISEKAIDDNKPSLSVSSIDGGENSEDEDTLEFKHAKSGRKKRTKKGKNGKRNDGEEREEGRDTEVEPEIELEGEEKAKKITSKPRKTRLARKTVREDISSSSETDHAKSGGNRKTAKVSFVQKSAHVELPEEDSDETTEPPNDSVAATSRPSSHESKEKKKPRTAEKSAPTPQLPGYDLNEVPEEPAVVTGFKLPEHLQPRPFVPMQDEQEDIDMQQTLSISDELISLIENNEYTERLSLLDPLELEDLSSVVSSIAGYENTLRAAQQREAAREGLRTASRGAEKRLESIERQAATPIALIGESGMDEGDGENAFLNALNHLSHLRPISGGENISSTGTSNTVIAKNKREKLIMTDDISEPTTPRATTAAADKVRPITNNLRAPPSAAPSEIVKKEGNLFSEAVIAAFAEHAAEVEHQQQTLENNPYPKDSRYNGPIPARLRIESDDEDFNKRKALLDRVKRPNDWMTQLSKEEWERELMNSFEAKMIVKVYEIIQKKLLKLCKEINDRFAIIDKHTVQFIDQRNYILQKLEKIIRFQQYMQQRQVTLLDTTQYLHHHQVEIETVNKDLIDPLHLLIIQQSERLQSCEGLIVSFSRRIEQLEAEKNALTSSHARSHRDGLTPPLMLLQQKATLGSAERNRGTTSFETAVTDADKLGALLYENKSDALAYHFNFLSKEIKQVLEQQNTLATEHEALTKRMDKVQAEQAKDSPRIMKAFSPVKKIIPPDTNLGVPSEFQGAILKEMLLKTLSDVRIQEIPAFQPFISDVAHLKTVIQMCFRLIERQQLQYQKQQPQHFDQIAVKELSFSANSEPLSGNAVEDAHRPSSTFNKKGRNLKTISDSLPLKFPGTATPADTKDPLPDGVSNGSNATRETKRCILPKKLPSRHDRITEPSPNISQALSETRQYLEFKMKVEKEAELKFSPVPPIKPRPPPHMIASKQKILVRSDSLDDHPSDFTATDD